MESPRYFKDDRVISNGKSFALSCQGGLNVNLNQLYVMRQLGLAMLLNFEVDPMEAIDE